MGLFAWMITGHFVGDFLLQTNWMACNKAKNFVALAVHSGVYTAAVSLLSLMSGGLRWYSILLLFVSHFLLDQRFFVQWWCRRITKSADIPYLVMVVDQSWHVLILAVACMLTGG